MAEKKLLRAYGDREGDGMVQMSFTLAVLPGDRAREAGKRFAEAHGLRDPLITTMGAAKQRARAELSESGRALKRKMTLPVLPATGIIKPGTFVRYTDEDAAIRLGLVRATNVSMQFPVLTQALEVDSHE